MSKLRRGGRGVRRRPSRRRSLDTRRVAERFLRGPGKEAFRCRRVREGLPVLQPVADGVPRVSTRHRRRCYFQLASSREHSPSRCTSASWELSKSNSPPEPPGDVVEFSTTVYPSLSRDESSMFDAYRSGTATESLHLGDAPDNMEATLTGRRTLTVRTHRRHREATPHGNGYESSVRSLGCGLRHRPSSR